MTPCQYDDQYACRPLKDPYGQAQGPQEGAGTAGSSERAKEQAKGPQEGAQ